MANVRAALKTKLEALTYSGVSPKVFDEGSTDLCMEAMEGKVFTGYLGLFIGDEILSSSPLSMGWVRHETTIEVYLSEKRKDYVSYFPLYVQALANGINRSTLDTGNVINVLVSAVSSPVERLHGKLWIQKVDVKIIHYVSVNTETPVHVNVDNPTCTIDTSIQSDINNAGDVTLTLTIVAGTATLSKLYVAAIEESQLKTFASYTSATAGVNTITLAEATVDQWVSGDSVTFYAVVTDEAGVCGEATPVVATIT